MKKKFNKKKLLMFGLPVLALVLVSGALLTYFSSVSTDVTVENPIVFGLYDTDSLAISGTQTMNAGETLKFFKVAMNKAEVGTKFAIALVVQGTQEGVIVDSSGPVNDAQDLKNTLGQAIEAGDATIWTDNNKFWQIDGDDWYLHDAFNKYEDYEYWFGGEWVSGANPQNTVYDDGGGVIVNEENYYIVIFGGTIGDTASVGTIEAGDLITNWGWGNAGSYTVRSEDEPLVMPPNNAYDLGKVRVHFASNLVPGDYIVKTAVITPGESVEGIINALFPV